MGCYFSKTQKSPSNYIRVVHLNGHVEDFDYPLTAVEVTGKPPTQFLCTQSQLMSGYLKPLKPDTQLESSHIYFMLSYSTIRSESSPMDVAMMARRLTKLAKESQARAASQSSNRMSTRGTSPGSESPSRSVEEFGKVGSRKGLWKPILDTIGERERVFSHKSESDLREMNLEIVI